MARCCFCGRPILGLVNVFDDFGIDSHAYGCNPEPLVPLQDENGVNVCCEICNEVIVMPTRMFIAERLEKRFKDFCE